MGFLFWRWGRNVDMAIEKDAVISVSIDWPTDNIHAVILARDYAKELGFCSISQSMIATPVTELATNIIKYAVKGSICMRKVIQDKRIGLEVLARDSGPGIADIQMALMEDFSTGDSLGLGLPGVKRMMDEFEMDSVWGEGTCITVRKWKNPDETH